jgi:hypothetical protein
MVFRDPCHVLGGGRVSKQHRPTDTEGVHEGQEIFRLARYVIAPARCIGLAVPTTDRSQNTVPVRETRVERAQQIAEIGVLVLEEVVNILNEDERQTRTPEVHVLESDPVGFYKPALEIWNDWLLGKRILADERQRGEYERKRPSAGR